MTGIETLERDIIKIPKKEHKPAILPVACAIINKPLTRCVIGELRETTPEQRLEYAINTFEQMYHENGKDSDKWTIELLNSIADGGNKTIVFLTNQGVFSDEKYLRRPKTVVPGMEITNINPKRYSPELQKRSETLRHYFFLEYMAMKNLLRIPIKGKPLRLNTQHSLLISDHTNSVIKDISRIGGLPLSAKGGPGGGEELILPTLAGISTLVYDILPFETSKNMFERTFRLSGYQCPEIINLAPNNKIALRPLSEWEKSSQKPMIFVCPKTDLSKRNAIPDELKGKAEESDSVWALHEIPEEEKVNFIENMVDASKNSVRISDGNPTKDALLKVVLPVGQISNLPITFSQAIVTYLLCEPPETLLKRVTSKKKDMQWQVSEFATPPPPLCYTLELTAFGQRQ